MAAFMRFNRLKDIGLTEQQIKGQSVVHHRQGEVMKSAINPRQAKEWLANPPDLTVIARASLSEAGTGADYSTPTCGPSTATRPRRPAGTTWPSRASGMPHVLWSCRVTQAGARRAWRAGARREAPDRGKSSSPARCEQEYDKAVGDLLPTCSGWPSRFRPAARPSVISCWLSGLSPLSHGA